MDDFDPYYIWLGIPPDEQPADHYRLLGLRRFEQNPDVIANAAEGKMAYLRTLQVGKRSKQSQALLNEIAAAQICLLNDKTRAEYDATLRAKDAARKPAAPRPAVASTAATPVVASRVAPPVAPLVPPKPVVGIAVSPTVPSAVYPVTHPTQSMPVSFPTYAPSLPRTRPAGAWQQLQAKLEALPKAAIIALGLGPVIMALLVLVAVIVATSGRPGPQPMASASLASASPSQRMPHIVPPRPHPTPPMSQPPPPAFIQQREPFAQGPAIPPMPMMHGMIPLQIDVADSTVHRTLLSASGAYLAIDLTLGGKRQVQVFHAQAGRKLMTIDGPAIMGRMSLADDVILIASEPMGITSFEAVSGRLRTLTRISGNIRDVALSPDGRWALVLTENELQLFDTEKFEKQANLLHVSSPHDHQRLMVRGNFVMAVGSGGLRAFRLDTRVAAAQISFPPTDSWRGFLDDQSFYRLYQEAGAVRYVRQGFSGQGRFAEAEIRGAPPVDRIVDGVQGGNLIAWRGSSTELALFDLLQSRPVARITSSAAELQNISLSADGQWMAAQDGNGPVLVVPVQQLRFGRRPAAWPDTRQLQPGRVMARQRTSVTGPAARNVGVASVLQNGPG